MNIVLKERPSGTQVKLNLGQMYRSDGELVQASVNHGLKLGSRGFLNLTGDYRNRGNANRAGFDQRQQYLPLADGSADPREASFEPLNHRYGDADSENLTLWANAETGVGDTGTFSFFGGYSGRKGESAGFYRRALDARTRPEIHPDGFLPLINTEVDDLSGSVGYRAVLGGWSLDTSLTSGSNSFEFIINNSNNVSIGPSSPTSARAGTLNFRQTTFNVDAFTDVDWGLQHPVQLAVGAEIRRDNYQIEAGERASWIDGGFPDQFGGQAAPGIQVFSGFRPNNEIDQSRTAVGAYVDLETRLRDDLLLATAVRFEDYTDFGSFLSGKVAARWELTDTFALRGSVSSGFRAPSLHQAHFNNTSTQFVFSDATGELVPFEVGTFANGGEVTNAFGVPSLREETARNMSLGFVARPASNWSLTGDVFFIGIEDRIVVSGQFQSETDPAGPIRSILQPFGVNAAQFFSNAIDTETVGADLVVAWFDQIGREGSLHLTGAANWNRTRVVGNVRTPPALSGLGATLFNRIERERIESAQPRSHYQLSARYTHPEIVAVVRANRFGSVKTVESAGNPALDQIFAAKWLVDLEFTHPLRSGLNISVGANNIFHYLPRREPSGDLFRRCLRLSLPHRTLRLQRRLLLHAAGVRVLRSTRDAQATRHTGGLYAAVDRRYLSPSPECSPDASPALAQQSMMGAIERHDERHDDADPNRHVQGHEVVAASHPLRMRDRHAGELAALFAGEEERLVGLGGGDGVAKSAGSDQQIVACEVCQ